MGLKFYLMFSVLNKFNVTVNAAPRDSFREADPTKPAKSDKHVMYTFTYLNE